MRTSSNGRDGLCPEWNTELWIPLWSPTATDRIKHVVADAEIASLETVATHYTKYREIDAADGKKTAVKWVNLYGAPTAATRILTQLTDGLKVGLEGGVDYRAQYNTFPDLGTTYRGRVLIAQKIMKELPKKEADNNRPFLPWKRSVKPLTLSKYPPTKEYILKLHLVSGTELPRIKGTMDLTRNRKVGVTVSCGKYSVKLCN
jgi:hypothetical protein